MRKLFLLFLLFITSCSNDNLQIYELNLREDVIVENAVFRISYNEKKEQPNWIEYTVRDFIKVADRGNMDFYTVRNIWTSNDNDYYENVFARLDHVSVNEPAGAI